MMKRFAFCIFLVFLLPPLVFGLEVRFRESAVARAPMLTLGDVAEFRSSSGAEKIGETALFPAPGPGERTCYKSGTLKAYIRRAVGPEREIEWTGAKSVCVRKAGTLVTPEKMAALVNDRLRSELAHISAQKVSFEFRNQPAAVSLPPGEVSCEVLFSDPDILDSRKATVIIRVDGQVAENVSIPGEVRAFLPVVAAAKKLNRGRVLTRADLVTRSKNIAGFSQPCLDPDEVTGQRLRRSVSMGRVLCKRDLERPVLVERRQMVTMVVQKGALRVQARGMATADGKKGDIVRVKNMRSQKTVHGKVVGDGLVEVGF